VADWRPAVVQTRKIKKVQGESAPALALTENVDILGTVAQLANPPYCVGFAAESHELLAHARAKRVRKGVPLIVGTWGRTPSAVTTTRCG